MLFGWDENKRDGNVAKHGLDLARGVELFDGRPVFSYLSPRNNEARVVTVGLLPAGLVPVVSTERGGVTRLISLRRARDGEKRAYRARFG